MRWHDRYQQKYIKSSDCSSYFGGNRFHVITISFVDFGVEHRYPYPDFKRDTDLSVRGILTLATTYNILNTRNNLDILVKLQYYWPGQLSTI